MPIIYNSNISGQPPQAIPTLKKDDDWKKANMDWLEDLLKTHLPQKRKKLIKNYNIAMGVIDIEDYIPAPENEYKNIIDGVEQAMQESLLEETDMTINDLNFYPIIPTIINTLIGEILKKFDHIRIKAIDDLSTNEMLDYKKEMMLEYLKSKYQSKVVEKLSAAQMDPESEEYQQAVEQETQKIMSLPEIQKFINRTYKNNYENWANKILEQAEFKYKLKDLEYEIAQHQLIADEAYTEVRINESDLEVINWNPIETLVIKPKHVKYTTKADVVARQYWTTIPDILSKYSNKLDHKLLEKYNTTAGIHPSFTDKRLQPDDYQSLMLPEKKLMAFKSLLGEMNIDPTSKVLLTEGYWVSMRRLTQLTAIYEGIKIVKILDDTFETTIKPEYDKDKNLIAGEEVEYFYIPQIYRGTKINFSEGSTASSTLLDENTYLDESVKQSNKNKLGKDIERGIAYLDIEPIEYQFTDEIQPENPLIPVMGCDGFDLNMNVGKLSLVDKTKSYQVLFNAFLNEIDMFAKTEIGLFYVMDQRLIPQNSLDGSWGKYNWLKFILTAKETGLGVVDNSTSNLEGGQAMQQPTVVNLLNNPRFQSRIELANFCENQILKIVGVSPQRQGSVSSQETATGINQSINNSYSQTERYSFNLSHYMRELKYLILDAEKYIESKKPTSRVNYINSDTENVIFEVDTNTLLLRRFNLFLTTNSDTQRVLESLRQLAIQNNTSGASILDLATIIESSNTREIKDVLEASINKQQQQVQEQRQHEQEMLNKQIESNRAEKQADREHEISENEKDRIKDMYIADVRALGFSKDPDVDDSGVNDVLEVQKMNLAQDKYYSDIINRENVLNQKKIDSNQKQSLEREKLNLKKQEIASKERIKKEEIRRDLLNQKNDERIAELNAKNRKK